MRIYYCAEAESPHHHVRTALRVDAAIWNKVSRRVNRWRKEQNDRYDIPEGSELYPCDLLTGGSRTARPCNCGIDHRLTRSRGFELVKAGLRLIEDIAVDAGGVGLINVCLDKDDVTAGRHGPSLQPHQCHRRPGRCLRLHYHR